MMAAEVVRARILIAVLDDAKEWRETFEEPQNALLSTVIFGEIGMTAGAERKGDRSVSGFEGALDLPREMAVEMMVWLEARARDELDKLGVKV